MLDLLSRLVNKSLVVAEASPAKEEGVLRYSMLEPVRQYGQERLEESGKAERVRERHARYYLVLAEQAGAAEADPELERSRPVAAWLERMNAEHGNLRAALSWALDREEDGEPEELGLRLAVALQGFWYSHHLIEGQRYLQRALSRTGSNPTTTRLRARALIGAGWIAITQADFGTSKDLMEEGLALCRELGDKEGIASGLTELGYVAVLGQRDDIPLPAVFEELMELKPQVENRNTLAYLLVLEGMIVGSRGDLESSVELHEEALELFRAMRDTTGILTCLTNLGIIALLEADYEVVASLLREALHQAREPGYTTFIQISLHGLACVAACRNQPIRAARVWGAVEGMQEAYGMHLTPITLTLTDYEGHLSTARSQLGAEAFAAAWAEGAVMPLEQAIEYALNEQEAAGNASPKSAHTKQPPAPPNALTRREREIADLVGEGLSNREISVRLGISERTVEGHVSKILRKLDLRSRTRIAAWVARR